MHNGRKLPPGDKLNPGEYRLVECAYCGKPFKRFPRRKGGKGRKTCSQGCADKRRAKRPLEGETADERYIRTHWPDTWRELRGIA